MDLPLGVYALSISIECVATAVAVRLTVETESNASKYGTSLSQRDRQQR